MFDSIYKDLKYKIRTGGFWMRCILLNVSIFVLINILKAWFTFQNGTSPGIEYYDIIHSVSLSSEWLYNFTHFWVWITHFFVHEGFFHLLWNMLWLYWLANIVDDLIGKNHSKYIYVEGAIAGGLFFMLSCAILPWYQNLEIHAYGASAAVMALMFAAATISPTYTIRLILIGPVQLKYLAMVLLVLDLLFAGQNSNSGGHFAHIGGAFWGWLYIVLLRFGLRMNFLEADVKPSRQNRRKEIPKLPEAKPKDDQLNQILEKIKIKGIHSLSKEEKEFLDKISKE